MIPPIAHSPFSKLPDNQDLCLIEAIKDNQIAKFVSLYANYKDKLSPILRAKMIHIAIVDNKENYLPYLCDGHPICPLLHQEALKLTIVYNRMSFFIALSANHSLDIHERASLIDQSIIEDKEEFFNLLLNKEPIDTIMMSTCLFHAIHLNRSLTMVKALVDNQLFSLSQRGWTLHQAILFNRPDVFDFLCEDLDITNLDRDAAIILAIKLKRAVMFYSLLKEHTMAPEAKKAALIHAQDHPDFLKALHDS